MTFAVANRHFVTVSFDPFNSTDPSVSVSLPLFVLIIAVAILGVVAGGCATWFGQRRWRRAARQHEADARTARAQLAELRASPARRGRSGWPCPRREPSTGLRARQAGRDVVEAAPLNPEFSADAKDMTLLVKICGLSTRETLDAALEAGADMVGFVFFPPSPRHLSLDTARELGRQVKQRAIKVALTVDADDATLEGIVEALRPTSCNCTAMKRWRASSRSSGSSAAR